MLEFYSNNKFEKLVHLVGFIIRIYHDARSPECQTGTNMRMFFATLHRDKYFAYLFNVFCQLLLISKHNKAASTNY